LRSARASEAFINRNLKHSLSGLLWKGIGQKKPAAGSVTTSVPREKHVGPLARYLATKIYEVEYTMVKPAGSGIPADVLRYGIDIEDAADLIADLGQALQRIN
jgi:O-acetylhomoserine/O-acetylserine sulfhydrylase-like pyridoxal-dependent enzyme